MFFPVDKRGNKGGKPRHCMKRNLKKNPNRNKIDVPTNQGELIGNCDYLYTLVVRSVTAKL